MNIYLVGVETSYEYCKFPWFKKSKCSMSLKENLQAIVAEDTKEAERKYWDAHPNKMVVWPLMPKCLWPIVCKPNQNCQIWIQELDKDTPIDEYLKYMTPEDFYLFQKNA